MEKQAKNPNWGGKREGAGRPRGENSQNIRITTVVTQEVFDWINSHHEPTSTFVFKVLRERMEQERK